LQKTKPRILFVDDHEDTRLVILTWLGVVGYEVVAVDGVNEGLRLAKNEKFDLYLLDSKFGDGSGKELCEKIREFDQTTPIVFFSGELPTQQELNLVCGAQGYVMKPEFDALPKVIDRALHAA
jgi:CheY-like chemotaxis protein